MKKVLIALGVLLVIVGVVMVAIGGGKDGFLSLIDTYPVSHDLYTATVGPEFSETQADQLKFIDISCETYSVYVRYASVNEYPFSVKYPQITDSNISVTCSPIGADGSLKISQINHKKFNLFSSIKSSDTFLVVTLPRSLTQLDVKINTNVGLTDFAIDCNCLTYKGHTGALELSNAKITGKLHAESNTGLISVKHVSFHEGVISATTGAITLDGVECVKLETKTTTGALKAKNVNVASSAEVETNTGSINFEGNAGSINLDTNTGSIRFDVTSDKISVSADTGSINGTIHKKQSEFDITVNKHLGSCNLSNQTVGRGKVLTVKNGTGSVDIKFTVV